MNHLALAQRLRQEAEIPGTGPSAVTSQTGQLKCLVDRIASAWGDVQRLEDWRWMRRPFTFNTVADDVTSQPVPRSQDPNGMTTTILEPLAPQMHAVITD